MRIHPGVLFVALAVVTVSGGAENGREEASPLKSAEVQSGGNAVPRVPKPRVRLKVQERKSVESKPEERQTEDRNPSEGKDPELLVLPKMEVTAPQDHPFEKRLEQLDEEQAWEERNTKLSWLDTLLNGKGFENARTARAKERVEIMNWERMLLVALLGAKTDDERVKIRSEIAMCKALRR
jgi:hypothetical protein